MSRTRQRIGAHGEALAVAWYRRRGYEIVDRNWRIREGELDVVARRGRLVVFCEVKARRTAAYGTPAESVTPAKQARVRRLAAAWLRESGVRPGRVRFDVAAVLGGELTMITSAF